MPKRSAVRITKRVVDALQPGQVAWDAEVKGFGVRCQVTSKVYVLKTVVNRRQVFSTIGTHGSPWTAETARAEAIRRLGRVAAGQDLRLQEAKTHLTMAELCGRYLSQYAVVKKKASSAELDRKNIQNHVLPLLGGKQVDQLSVSDVEAFKSAVRAGKTAPADADEQRKKQGGGIVVRGGPGVANRCLTLLSKMMNLAELWKLRPRASNPVAGVARFAENPKDRFLTKAELKRLHEVLEKFEREGNELPSALAAIRLLILTGARLSEILKLEWAHVQLERARLRLPDSKTGAKTIILPQPAIELLKSIPVIEGNPYVIIGGRDGKHLVDLQRPWQRIRKAAGIEDVRIHDLRHTFASVATQGGISEAVIRSLLGHRSSETTRRYAHLGDEYPRAENERIAKLLTGQHDEPPEGRQAAGDDVPLTGAQSKDS